MSLYQDTDSPPTKAEVEYWSDRLKTSPGMEVVSWREKQRRMALALAIRAERLRRKEAELREFERELLKLKASLALPPVDKLPPKVADIARLCAEGGGIAMTDMISPRRPKAVVRARQVGMYLSKKLTSRSLPDIGTRFGGKDHSTVLHAVRRIEELIKAGDETVIALIVHVVRRLGLSIHDVSDINLSEYVRERLG